MTSFDPTGNGEQRGPEYAPGNPGSLPGTRPERAARNNARNAGQMSCSDPMDQAGFGSENMIHACDYLGTESVRPSDALGGVPDLAAMGDAGQTFGGM